MRLPLFAALLVLAAPAWAQTPDTTAAAATVVELLSPIATERATIATQMAAVRRGESLRAMFSRDPGFRQEQAKNQPRFNSGLARAGAILADSIGPVQMEMLAANRRLLIQGYAKRFSVAELNTMAAFFRSPLGARLVREQGLITTEASRAVQQQYAARLQAAQQTAGPKVQAELAKLTPPAAPK